jgi:hypothetical protein
LIIGFVILITAFKKAQELTPDDKGIAQALANAKKLVVQQQKKQAEAYKNMFAQ